MTARATKARDAIGINAITGRVEIHVAGSGGIVYVPDDHESVAGWADGNTFWPARLDTIQQLDTARNYCRRHDMALGGSPLTSRQVFRAINPNH